MTAVWAVSAAAGWLVLSGVVGVVVGRMLRLRDQPAPACGSAGIEAERMDTGSR